MVRRIEDAAAALIAAGSPKPTNVQVRDHLGGGSLATISPAMRAFRARQREQAREETFQLPPELQQADLERNAELAKVAELESQLAVLREVQAESDRLQQGIRQLRDEALPLREQVARLTATGEHLSAQLKETKAELKGVREENRALQAQLLELASQTLAKYLMDGSNRD